MSAETVNLSREIPKSLPYPYPRLFPTPIPFGKSIKINATANMRSQFSNPSFKCSWGRRTNKSRLQSAESSKKKFKLTSYKKRLNRPETLIHLHQSAFQTTKKAIQLGMEYKNLSIQPLYQVFPYVITLPIKTFKHAENLKF